MPLKNRLSRVSKARQSNPIRDISEVVCASKEGDSSLHHNFIQLGYGDPNHNLFPWESAIFKLRDGSELHLDSEVMTKALQYGSSGGYAPLVEAIGHLQTRLHGNASNILARSDAWGVLPVCGAMDGISKAFEMFLNEHDSYLIEVPAYSGIYGAVGPLNGRAICCQVDEGGLNPVRIRAKIVAALKKGWPAPKFLYTCSTATNPSGVTTTAERRRQIYQLACEFDFYIIEDDPYYFIRFDDQPVATIPSYLSLDTEGRVLRVDSFSKVLSAGIRLGFITASTELIQQLTLHMQTSQIHPSQLSQALVAQLLNDWGQEKFLEHTRKVAAFYKNQMKMIVNALERHLSGLVQYQIPCGGLFLWFKVPAIKDTKALINKRVIPRRVMLVHGTAFQPDFAEPDQLTLGGYHQYIRASYSLVDAKQMDIAFKMLREAIDEELMMAAEP